MDEEGQKEIDWKKIARTFAFSLVWYISISAIWWIIGVGTEILFTDYLSMSLGANFIGLWSNLGENDFTFDVGLTWWVNDIHGVALEYNHAFDQEVNFIGLKYLYSWQ